ncbi:hypothetical protein IAI10_16270 [Clostridium sp. 19966]|uniref:hypothetical protein n=1 Tax=Clostridium sp. 19966 TaxID=2768166 RepID=UPI0028E08EC2|nr:hypothetical protein [Clostridium sp. 19966]MDT8718223.1 hypothetical protein [Clostridium sp. 19966]
MYIDILISWLGYIFIMYLYFNIFKELFPMNKKRFILIFLLGAALSFLSFYLGLVLSAVSLILMLILILLKQCNKDKFKKYIQDNSIKGYNIIFKMVNGKEIDISTTVEGFEKIKNWFENDSEESYSSEVTCSSKEGIISGKTILLNKVNIVEFSFETVTNRINILNFIKYIFTYPAPKLIDLTSFARSLFAIPTILIIYILYSRYALNISINSTLNNENAINYVFHVTMLAIAIVFIIAYLIFFLIKIFFWKSGNRNYFYKVESQRRYKIYDYAISNFLVIALFSHVILSTVLF